MVESEAVMRLESGGELSNFRIRKFFDNRGKDRKRRRRGPTKWAFNTGTIKFLKKFKKPNKEDERDTPSPTYHSMNNGAPPKVVRHLPCV
ncbi:hypothetical protein ACHWQZ_G017667 [Mnemiopsis leidyi]